jgi:hypothetical protein
MDFVHLFQKKKKHLKKNLAVSKEVLWESLAFSKWLIYTIDQEIVALIEEPASHIQLLWC